MKKYIIILLLTTISLSAQKIVTKYNKYMYGGTPSFIWWNQFQAFSRAQLGSDTEHEKAAPSRAKSNWDYTYDQIPLSYFYDKNFSRNRYIKQLSRMRIKNHSMPPSHMVKELGPPKNITFNKANNTLGKTYHVMTYMWFGSQSDNRKYMYFNGKTREVFGIKAVLVKTKGDFSKNDIPSARRSKWVITDAMLTLMEARKPTDCWMNICNSAFPCGGHGLSYAEKARIAMARTAEEQETLRMGYHKKLTSKFAKSKELREQLQKESKWYLEKASALRREVTIVRK